MSLNKNTKYVSISNKKRMNDSFRLLRNFTAKWNNSWNSFPYLMIPLSHTHTYTHSSLTLNLLQSGFYAQYSLKFSNDLHVPRFKRNVLVPSEFTSLYLPLQTILAFLKPIFLVSMMHICKLPPPFSVSFAWSLNIDILFFSLSNVIYSIC